METQNFACKSSNSLFDGNHGCVGMKFLLKCQICTEILINFTYLTGVDSQSKPRPPTALPQRNYTLELNFWCRKLWEEKWQPSWPACVFIWPLSPCAQSTRVRPRLHQRRSVRRRASRHRMISGHSLEGSTWNTFLRTSAICFAPWKQDFCISSLTMSQSENSPISIKLMEMISNIQQDLTETKFFH